MAKKQTEDKFRKWKILIIIVVGLWLVSFIGAKMFKGLAELDNRFPGNANVAIIPVHGVISVSSGGPFDNSVASSSEIVKLIESADEDKAIKAILFDINSPGGSAVASEEISNAIKRVNKTTVSLIREVGASGGFWIATSTDYAFANPVSITGSIGVISSYLDFSELIEEYNVSYERLVAGKYKDLGSPFRKLSEEERELFQGKLDYIHEYFIKEVAENRDLDYDEVKEQATGMIFLGAEAKELGFVDELGDKRTVIDFLEKELNTTVETTTFRTEKTLLDIFGGIMSEYSFFLGKGLGSSMTRDDGMIVRT